MKDPLRNISLRQKLVFHILAISLAAIIGGGFFTYRVIRNNLKSQLLNNLALVAESKEGHIYTYIIYLKASTEGFASDGVVRESLEWLNTRPSYTNWIIDNLNHHLLVNKLAIIKGVFQTDVIDMAGLIVASSNKGVVGQDESSQDYFIKGKEKTYLSDFVYSSYDHKKIPSLIISAPIRDKSAGKPWGVLINRVGTEEFGKILEGQFQLELGASSGLKGKMQSFDTYLVNKDGLMVTKSRFMALETAFLRQPVKTPPVLEAFKGKEYSGVYLDYRDREVIGAAMYFPEKGWALLVEVDTEEGFALLNTVKKGILLGIATVVFFALPLVFLFTPFIVRPLEELIRAMNKLDKGDLSVDIKTDSKDEIGQLAKAFNQMTQSLRSSRIKIIQALEQSRQSLRKVTNLYEINKTLVGPLDTKEILQTIAKQAAALPNIDSATIMLVNSQTNILEPVVSQGKAGKQEACPHLNIGEGAAGWVAREGRVLVIPDIRKDGRFLTGASATNQESGSYLGIPLAVEGKIIGVLNLSKKGPYEFTTGETEFFSAIGIQAAIAIKNAQIYETIEQRAKELSDDFLEQKHFLESVLYAMGDGVFSSDRDRRILTWSRGAEEITGYKAEEVIGKRCSDFLQHRDKEGNILKCFFPACPFEQILNGPEQAQVEYVSILTRSGEQRDLGVRATGIRDAQGEIIAWVQVFRDMTREREVDRMKTEFISTVSHELRTPLTPLMGFSELLLRQDLPEDKRIKYARIINEETKRLTQLIEEILDLRRIEAGRMELKFNPESISSLIISSMELMEKMSDRHDIEFIVPADLPEVRIDRHKIIQVLNNIINNAIKYSPQGGKIRIKADPLETDYVTVSVSDEGVGMPAENLPSIFPAFYRVDHPETRDVGGAGLGLTITANIIQMHGGTIWVESEAGKGSTFYFTLPIVK